MDFAGAAMTVLIGLAVFSLMVYSLLGPREVWDLAEEKGLLARLKKGRERLLRTLKDLEFEHDSGKLSDEEFRELRNSYKRRAIQAAKDLERLRRARLRILMKKGRGVTPSQRKRIEALVAKRAQDQPSTSENRKR